MNKQDAKELLELNDKELRLFLVLRTKLDRWGEVAASMDDLEELTGYSRSSVSRAVKQLVAQGFVEVDRTKRNFGMLSYNRYRVLRCVTSETSEAEIAKKADSPRVTTDTPTASYTSLNKLVTINTINTSYLLSAKGAGTKKEKKMVNKWSDDDDLGGVGIFEEEFNKPEKISKANVHTRSLRPQSEWTAKDVAAEFSERIYKKIPNTPGVVNGKELSIILATNRKKFGTTAEIELAVLEKFFDDERNITRLKANPFKSHLKFISEISRTITQVRDELDIAEPNVDIVRTVDYVYASDGKAFDNSMPGRRSLERYEEKLKGN